MKIHIDIPALLAFYDGDKSVRRHSNAIKTLGGEELGLALLLEHFALQNIEAKVLDKSCTAKERGNWLDAWVETHEADGHVLYQTEVKSWSFHGYGGGEMLSHDADGVALAAFKKREFSRYWDTAKGRFHQRALDKVLREMKTEHTGEVRALACLWTPLHPDGLDEPMFAIDGVKDAVFDRVWVFSASAFLRKYRRERRTNTIALNLPDTQARLESLNRIYSLLPSSAQTCDEPL